MLILNGAQLPLKNLRISVRQQLAGQDMSGQTSATDQADKLECLTQQIKVLENRVAEIGGNHTETVKGNRAIKANNITEDADTIKFNGGKGVCTGASICPFMGKPHVDVSTTVFAGKD